MYLTNFLYFLFFFSLFCYRTKNDFIFDSNDNCGGGISGYTVAITINKCAISATRCFKSGAARSKFSLAKSHDGNI